MRFPRVLVISNNCFSYTSSNGRTLGNFFINWDKDSLSQFYIQSEMPSSDICNNYYRITDIEILKSLFTFRQYGRILKEDDIVSNTEKTRTDKGLERIIKTSKMRRTPLLQLSRNLLWYSGRWKTIRFNNWLSSFNPEAIILQAGDSIFMYDIALHLSIQFNIPLIIYNSEDHYFKDRGSISPIFHIYRRFLKKRFDKLMANTEYIVYISDMLKDDFDKIFNVPGEAIYTASTIFSGYTEKNNNPPMISYLGNIGFKRWKSLIEIGKAIQSINNDYYIDIYTQIVPPGAKEYLTAKNGIMLKGSIPYDEVIKTIKESDLLLYVESLSDFTKWDLRNAFSTKIADSLSCGTCLIAYGPEEIASIRYLKENGAAYVISDKRKLLPGLKEIINDKKLRKKIVKNAHNLARKRHDADNNSKRFESIIRSVVESSKRAK
jgi:glycosyltransferase involved in cell wall biosynthesis